MNASRVPVGVRSFVREVKVGPGGSGGRLRARARRGDSASDIRREESASGARHSALGAEGRPAHAGGSLMEQTEATLRRRAAAVEMERQRRDERRAIAAEAQRRRRELAASGTPPRGGMVMGTVNRWHELPWGLIDRAMSAV